MLALSNGGRRGGGGLSTRGRFRMSDSSSRAGAGEEELGEEDLLGGYSRAQSSQLDSSTLFGDTVSLVQEAENGKDRCLREKAMIAKLIHQDKVDTDLIRAHEHANEVQAQAFIEPVQTARLGELTQHPYMHRLLAPQGPDPALSQTNTVTKDTSTENILNIDTLGKQCGDVIKAVALQAANKQLQSAHKMKVHLTAGAEELATKIEQEKEEKVQWRAMKEDASKVEANLTQSTAELATKVEQEKKEKAQWKATKNATEAGQQEVATAVDATQKATEKAEKSAAGCGQSARDSKGSQRSDTEIAQENTQLRSEFAKLNSLIVRLKADNAKLLGKESHVSAEKPPDILCKNKRKCHCPAGKVCDIECIGQNVCSGGVFTGNFRKLVCKTTKKENNNACSNLATIVNADTVECLQGMNPWGGECGGAKGFVAKKLICDGSAACTALKEISRADEVHCKGWRACQESAGFEAKVIICEGEIACIGLKQVSKASERVVCKWLLNHQKPCPDVQGFETPHLHCEGAWSCYGMKRVTDVQNVVCKGHAACHQVAGWTNVEKLSCEGDFNTCAKMNHAILPGNPLMTVTNIGHTGLSSTCIAIPANKASRQDVVGIIVKGVFKGSHACKLPASGQYKHWTPSVCAAGNVFCSQNQKCQPFADSADILKTRICPMNTECRVASSAVSMRKKESVNFFSWQPTTGYQNADVIQMEGNLTVLVGTSAPLHSLSGVLFMVTNSLQRPKCCASFLVPATSEAFTRAGSALVKLCGGSGGLEAEASSLMKPQISLANVVLAQQDLGKAIQLKGLWKKGGSGAPFYSISTISDTVSICALSGLLDIEWKENTGSMDVLDVPDDCVPTSEFEFQSAANVNVGGQQQWPTTSPVSFRLVITSKILVLKCSDPSAKGKLQLSLDGALLIRRLSSQPATQKRQLLGNILTPVLTKLVTHAPILHIGSTLESRSCWFTGEATFRLAKDGTGSSVAQIESPKCFPTHALSVFGKVHDSDGVLHSVVVVQIEPNGVLRIIPGVQDGSKAEDIQVDLRGAFFYPLVATYAAHSCAPRCFPPAKGTQSGNSTAYACVKQCRPGGGDSQSGSCSCNLLKRVICSPIGSEVECAQMKKLIGDTVAGCHEVCARQLAAY